jgi:hypothetical protein
MKAAAELRGAFGDVAEARDVLVRLADVLGRMDTVETDGTAHSGTKAKSKHRPAG